MTKVTQCQLAICPDIQRGVCEVLFTSLCLYLEHCLPSIELSAIFSQDLLSCLVKNRAALYCSQARITVLEI